MVAKRGGQVAWGLLELLRNARFCEEVLKEGTSLSFKIRELELTFRG